MTVGKLLSVSTREAAEPIADATVSSTLLAMLDATPMMAPALAENADAMPEPMDSPDSVPLLENSDLMPPRAEEAAPEILEPRAESLAPTVERNPPPDSPPADENFALMGARLAPTLAERVDRPLEIFETTGLLKAPAAACPAAENADLTDASAEDTRAETAEPRAESLPTTAVLKACPAEAAAFENAVLTEEREDVTLPVIACAHAASLPPSALLNSSPALAAALERALWMPCPMGASPARTVESADDMPETACETVEPTEPSAALMREPSDWTSAPAFSVPVLAPSSRPSDRPSPAFCPASSPAFAAASASPSESPSPASRPACSPALAAASARPSEISFCDPLISGMIWTHALATTFLPAMLSLPPFIEVLYRYRALADAHLASGRVPGPRPGVGLGRARAGRALLAVRARIAHGPRGEHVPEVGEDELRRPRLEERAVLRVLGEIEGRVRPKVSHEAPERGPRHPPADVGERAPGPAHKVVLKRPSVGVDGAEERSYSPSVTPLAANHSSRTALNWSSVSFAERPLQ